jgi:hypothetical protein
MNFKSKTFLSFATALSLANTSLVAEDLDIHMDSYEDYTTLYNSVYDYLDRNEDYTLNYFWDNTKIWTFFINEETGAGWIIDGEEYLFYDSELNYDEERYNEAIEALTAKMQSMFGYGFYDSESAAEVIEHKELVQNQTVE